MYTASNVAAHHHHVDANAHVDGHACRRGVCDRQLEPTNSRTTPEPADLDNQRRVLFCAHGSFPVTLFIFDSSSSSARLTAVSAVVSMGMAMRMRSMAAMSMRRRAGG
jgi:hypothetical protein